MVYKQYAAATGQQIVKAFAGVSLGLRRYVMRALFFPGGVEGADVCEKRVVCPVTR